MKKQDKEYMAELKDMTGRMSPFSKYLDMTLHNFIRITPEDKRKLFEAYYGPDWRSKVKPSVMTCSTCTLSEVKKIAIEYFGAVKTLKEMEAKASDKNKSDDHARS